MAAQLTVEYDAEADILYLGRVAPYAEQESEEVDSGVVARLNPSSGAVENLEILSFLKRLTSGDPLLIPVTADFQLPGA